MEYYLFYNHNNIITIYTLHQIYHTRVCVHVCAHDCIEKTTTTTHPHDGFGRGWIQEEKVSCD